VEAVVPDRASGGYAAPVAMSAVAAADPRRVHTRPVAGVREATGCPERQIAVDTGMAIDTSLAKCAGHQPSGERSIERPFPKHRTVNPPIARNNFL
jgi:hypothetical protein